jgi:hypothetical protein
MSYSELSLVAQNSYANLFDAALAMRFVAKPRGSFSKKLIKDRNYWYFQFRDIDQTVKQIYVGAEGERINLFIAQYPKNKPNEAIGKMAGSSVSLGCAPVLGRHFRIIKRLDEYGFFQNGGILVGTHAFLSLANMLGIRPDDRMQTQDVDFAHAGKNISIALPSNTKINVRSAIESLEYGLIPVSTLSGKEGATFVDPKDPSFRVDFLTAQTSIDDTPVYIDGLSIALQPLKFMEFSMANFVQVALMSKDDALIVNVPSPERFAIHKLIVSAERKPTETARINKDVRQANVFIDYYMQNNPDAIRDAAKEARTNGKGWSKRLREGVKRLQAINQKAAAFLLAE